MGITAAVAGVAAAGTSIGSTISNDVSGGSNAPATGTQGGSPGTYIPTAQPQADQLYQQIYNQAAPYAQAIPGETIPGLQTATTNIQNNPYQAQAQTGANTAAQLGTTAAGYQSGGASALYGAAGQVLNTGFDSQQALYNSQVQQLQDQYGAANAQAGLSGPAAAGVENQALNSYNLNWENAQLGRQESALSSAGQGYSGASTLGTLAGTTTAAASALPSSTYLSGQGNDIAALNSLTSGTASALQPEYSISNLLDSYLGLGQAATGQAIAGQNQAFNQNAALGQGLGSTLGGLSSNLSTLFGGASSAPYTGSGVNYSPAAGYTATDTSGGIDSLASSLGDFNY